VSFRENHWRGPADPHTVALTNAVTHAEKADDLHQELGRHLGTYQGEVDLDTSKGC